MKRISVITTMLLILLSFVESGSAEEIGDVVGHTYHTDIAAYVNNYALPSYAADGNSVIVAEDLRNCGFDVVWDENARSLEITRNPELEPVGMTVQKGGGTGIRFMDILYTDIKVYAHGVQIPSYAIQGYTVIPMESLTMLGNVEWVSSERTINLWVDGMNIRSEKQPVYQRMFVDNMIVDENKVDTRYYDLDIDGHFESFAVNPQNNQNIELLINEKSYVTENRFETGLAKVFVTDIDQADRALDIVVVTSADNLGVRVYQYKNGELIKQQYVYELNAEKQFSDVFSVKGSGYLKVKAMPSRFGTTGFYVYTAEEKETHVEKTDDGGKVMHVSLDEHYSCFEKVSNGEYASVNEEDWDF